MLYKFQSPERAFSQGREIPLLPFLCLFLFGFCLTVITALIFTSSTLANVSICTFLWAGRPIGALGRLTCQFLRQDRIPFPGHKSSFPILRQHYQFVVDGPRLIKKGYTRFKDGLFEIPRTFRFGQVVLCSTELIEELRNIRGNLVSPEPWIDQVRTSSVNRGRVMSYAHNLPTAATDIPRYARLLPHRGGVAEGRQNHAGPHPWHSVQEP